MTKSRIFEWLLVVLLWSLATTAGASFHLWRVNEIYSNADGTIQFIEFREIGGSNGEQFLAEHTVTSTRGTQTHTFRFPDDLPSAATANRSFLMATQQFANLGIVAPDYIIPAGFLFTDGATLQYGGGNVGPYPTAPVDTLAYPALPVDGVSSIDRNGTPQTNSPTNFAGATGAIAPTPAASPQTGWWWNPAESGRGYFIERQGSNLFFASYLYADDGRALWAISAGPMASISTYQGSLMTFASGQTLAGPYHPPLVGPALGAVSLQFSDALHGTMTWPGGTVAIERLDFGGLSAPPIAGAPETGWWWNDGESGRGFSLEVQGSTLFIAGYMYDSGGNPVWYIAAGPMANASQYQGSFAQYANGQTLTGAYRPPSVVNANVGSVSLQFSGTQAGMLTLPDGRMVPITRFRF